MININSTSIFTPEDTAIVKLTDKIIDKKAYLAYFYGETEERSEYHRQNIENYPDKKKFMEQWTSSAAEYHKEFEERVRARDYHRLDLSEYYAGKNSQTLGTSSQNIAEELKELKKLYDERALTKEEFTKAKKKLLNSEGILL